MRTVRHPLWLALLALVAACLVSGCMGGSSDREATSGAEATGEEQQDAGEEGGGVAERAGAAGGGASSSAAAEPAGPGRLDAGLPAGCRRAMRALDTAHARDVAKSERTLQRRDAASRSLRQLKARLGAADRAVEAERRAYDASRKPLEAFLADHPEQYLDSATFDRYEVLRDAHDSARAPYDRAVSTYDDLVARHNRQVATFNTLTARANRLGKSAGVRHDRFQARVATCLRQVDDWDARVEPLERRLGETAMAGADGPFATVSCDSPATWAESSRGARTPETFERHGYVVVGETEIHLGPRACYVLDLLFAQRTPTLACVVHEVRRDFPLCVPSRAEAAVALTTLAHEAQHVAGARDEAKAECAALQTVDTVGAALGLPAATTSRLARFTMRRVTLPANYRSAECKRGGALDMEPGTRAWP